MRKSIAILLGLAAVAAVLVTVSAVGASASNGGQAQRLWGRSTGAAPFAAPATAGQLVLLTKTERFKAVDADDNSSDSVGDYILFSESLWNAGGRRIGMLWATCTHHFGGGAMCDATLRLSGRGTITVAGVVGERNSLLAVTGGTDRFADADGQMDTSGDTGETGRLVVDLRHLG
jgi:hypothetical protein